MQRAVLAAVGRAGDADLVAVGAVLARRLSMSCGIRSDSSPLGPLTVTRSGSIAIVTPAGTGMGCLPIRDIVFSRVYQTVATTSPPTPWMRALWPVITPREVEMIAVPMPPWTRGMWA